MSNHLISEAYKRQIGNMARKAVMVLLADKASDDGTGIWASKQRMAEELGASKQTVIATIKSLIADGLVKEDGQRRCANGYTIQYAINVRSLRALPLVKSHAIDQSENLTGQNAAPVNESDLTSQIVLPDQSEDLTQTLLNPPEPPIKNTHKRERVSSHLIPEGWKPSQFGIGTKSRAVVDGWPPGECEAQLEHFTAHHRGKGNRFTDWQDAWSTWVLNNRRFGGGNNGRSNQNFRAGSGGGPDKRSGLAKALDRGIGI